MIKPLQTDCPVRVVDAFNIQMIMSTRIIILQILLNNLLNIHPVMKALNRNTLTYIYKTSASS